LHIIDAYGGGPVRTTLNLDDDLVRELMEVSNATTKTAAIHEAIEELIRRRKLEKLKSLSGRVRLSIPRARRERREIERQKRILRRQHGDR
jgi:hypothetical protein